MSAAPVENPVEVGLHALPADEYHADPCVRPSLSASLVHTLVTKSALHAWTEHPRLNPEFFREEEQKFDVGTAAHALLLEGTDNIAVCDFADWRSNAAKEARDAARASNQTPLLAKHADAVRAMAASTRSQLRAMKKDVAPIPFTDGKPEQCLVWQEGGIYCRALVDWLRDDLVAIDDFKTTKASANPESWTRSTLYSIGADIQVAFYLRGIRALMKAGKLETTDRDPEWRFVVQETSPPYALSVISLGPSVLALARRKIDHALELWRRCIEINDWPAYPHRVCWAELPPWEEARWYEREAMEEAA